MSFFANIRSVAKYESKLLLRSWFFKVFVGLAFVFLCLIDYNALFNDFRDILVSNFPANIPYYNILLLNVGEAVIAVFLATEFLKRDRKLDTSIVFYVRPLSNAEYLLGKTWGFLQVFFVINLILYGLVLAMNLLATGVEVAWWAYPYYFLIITVPTLVYIAGLSVFVMQLIRNQALTFVLLLGYIAVSVFYIGDNYYCLFDYMAWNLPLFHSMIAGTPNVDAIIYQRLLYLFFGFGFISLNIVLFRRLSNYAHSAIPWAVVAGLMFVFGGYFGYRFVERSARIIDNKQLYIEINNRYVHTPKIVVEDYHLDVEQLPEGIRAVCTIEGSALDSSERFTFTLNPGLRITSVTCDSADLNYLRDHQIIQVDFGRLVQKDSTLHLTIAYEGTLDESFCYLDIPEDLLLEPKRQSQISLAKTYVFQQPDYLLLTPELYWYPRPGTSYSDQSSDWQQTYFSQFEMDVRPLPGMRPISQGEAVDDSTGVFRFKPEYPMQSASLIIGRYIQKSLTVDSVKYSLWRMEQTESFGNRFDTIMDTIPSVLRNIRNQIEFFNKLEYPFTRFSVVEVPAQFTSYSRAWTRAQETMQPEMVLFPEKGYFSWNYDIDQMKRMFERNMRYGAPAMSEREMMTVTLNNMLSLFTMQENAWKFERGAKGKFELSAQYNPYYIFPQLFNFRYNIYSSRWPIGNRLIELYLQNQSTTMDGKRNVNGLSNDEKANLVFQKQSFVEALADPENRELTDNMIGLQGGRLFAPAALEFGEDKIRDSLYAVLDDYTFQNISFEALLETMGRISGVDIIDGTADWDRVVPMPAYDIGAPKAVRFNDRGEELYQFEMVITNVSDNPGILSIFFPWIQSANPDAPKTNKWMVHFDPHETKRIIRHWRDRPQWVDVFTFISTNLPLFVNQQVQFVGDENLNKKIAEGDYTIERVPREEPGAIVVDNEDSLLFSLSPPHPSGLLSRWIDGTDKDRFRYAGIAEWANPVNWTLNTMPSYYGDDIRSAYVIRTGSRDQYAVWKVPLPEKGRYEVSYYVSRPPMLNWGWFRGRAEYHFEIDDGEVVHEEYLELRRASDGWNSMGTYLFDTDTVQVTLFSETEVNTVTADAIKFVKR